MYFCALWLLLMHMITYVAMCDKIYLCTYYVAMVEIIKRFTFCMINASWYIYQKLLQK